MRKILAAAIVLTLVVAAPIQGQAGARGAIEQLLTDFAAAFTAKDAATLASFYADDAMLMPQGSPVVQGQPAIRSALMTMVGSGGVLHFNPPLAVDVVGDRAFAAGTYTLTIAVPQPGGGTAPLVIAAKYLTVFRRVGNGWRILFDMQNGDAPAPR